MSDWVMQCPKTKSQRTIKDFIVKGETVKDIINNPLLISRAIKKLGTQKKFLTWKPIKVDLKSQHGYGPRFEDEQLFQNDKK